MWPAAVGSGDFPSRLKPEPKVSFRRAARPSKERGFPNGRARKACGRIHASASAALPSAAETVSDHRLLARGGDLRGDERDVALARPRVRALDPSNRDRCPRSQYCLLAASRHRDLLHEPLNDGDSCRATKGDRRRVAAPGFHACCHRGGGEPLPSMPSAGGGRDLLSRSTGDDAERSAPTTAPSKPSSGATPPSTRRSAASTGRDALLWNSPHRRTRAALSIAACARNIPNTSASVSSRLTRRATSIARCASPIQARIWPRTVSSSLSSRSSLCSTDSSPPRA